MPVKKCPNGKWRIGSGPCMYTSKEAADKAYRAYLAKSNNSETFMDSITLCSGHSIILSHKPEKLQMIQINQILEEHPQAIEQFGLFDRASPNYTTYYPEVTEEDLNPKDSEFIEPIFRILSNVTVHPQWNPIYFPIEVLKKGMYKLIGQTINIDHEIMVGNAIGSVKSAEWQNAYTSNGIKIPAGINAVLKIDGKSNPRIARGIMMDPPSIHSNSVTVSFSWKQSHPKMNIDEFRARIGQFDEEGKLIQRIANEIVAFAETSLVSFGADPFAQKIKDGKIVNPVLAGARYKLTDQSLNDEDKKANSYLAMDWKSFKSEEVIFPIQGSNSFTIPEDINNINQKIELMEMLRFLEIAFGLEVNSLTEENYEEKIKGLNTEIVALREKDKAIPPPVKVLDIEGVELIEKEIKDLRAFKATVPVNLTEQIALADTGKIAVTELKADTKRLYGLSVGEGKEDATILALIEGADYKTLQSLYKQYNEATEKLFEFTCKSCGSHDVTRASATPATEDKTEPKEKTTEELIDKFTSVDNVVLPSSLKK